MLIKSFGGQQKIKILSSLCVGFGLRAISHIGLIYSELLTQISRRLKCTFAPGDLARTPLSQYILD